MAEYLQAIRECCRDEAAFEKLQQILADTGIPNLEKTKDELRHSEFKFPRMADNLPGMIYQYLRTHDGRESLVCATSGYRELFELEPENMEANFQLLKGLIHPDDLKTYEESGDISAATLQPWAWEGRIITPTGKIKWIQCASRPEKQPNGDIIWDGLMMEVTQSKAAQEALERERRLFIGGPVTVFRWVAQENWPVEYVSPNVAQFGYQPEDFLTGKVPYASIVHPDDLARVDAEIQAYSAEKSVSSYEQDYRLIRSDGSVRWVYDFTTIVRNERGEIIHYDGYILDVTERKAAEAQLGVAAERDRLLGEISLRIRRSLDLDQILNTTVEEVRQFLQTDRVFIGHLNDNCQGKVLAESVDPNWRSIRGWVTNDRHLKEIKSLFKQGHVRAIDDTQQVAKSRFHAAYYTKYQIRASLCVPIMVGDQFFGMLIANQCSAPRHWQQFEIDLLSSLATQVAIAIQQAQLYEQLSELNDSLETQVLERTAELQQAITKSQELNRLKDVVLNTVYHELRTPVLGNLLLLNNFLKSPQDTIPISRHVLERMIQGSDRQLGMINLLLEISQEPGIVLHPEPLLLNTILTPMLKDLQPIIKANQANITNLVSEDLPLVMVDAAKLQRALQDLFTHILKHNPPGISLTLSATIEAGMLRCTIQDNGAGMSQSECDRLFDLHVRDARDSCTTGIGLKLYLCRQAIAAHGGEIGVISHPNRGSTFWFTLPIKN